MPVWIALLRAINVGGTGKLPMAELINICEATAFQNISTYIASGNLVFLSDLPQESIKSELDQRLEKFMSKPVGVILRSMTELAALIDANPFPNAAPNQTLVTCLNDPPAADTLARISHQLDEDIALGPREIYVHYPQGQGRSKLKIPAAENGTARNLNTLKKLLEMAQAKDR